MTGVAGSPYDGVLFDFSGVMVGSAFDALGKLGPAHGMGHDEMLEFLLGPYDQDTDHAWHRVERGEIGIIEWVVDAQSRAEAAGFRLDLTEMRSMLGELGIHEVMVDAVRRTRAAGLRTGLLTNNVAEARDEWRVLLPLAELFDDVVDSSEVGLRKPDPSIYVLACERLGVEPAHTVFLDDAPGNCAGARSVGLTAILVDDPVSAVLELDALLGLRR